ncbi:MAG: secondary thiamine-phosphate synthase enzyme YjbQ [Myxococcales bacterium]|nr:secondary thiamine-phosphate synthase enzyme YjbQ [Myxococcales bacterium]MDH3842859.1 secondary thiamine-phosphate synthase enzyme YjbQ [Myxococcales bacterium]
MKLFSDTITLSTRRERELVDVTVEAQQLVQLSGVREGVCAMYAHGATAALMVQENADPNIGRDVVNCLDKLVPKGVWLHDRIDGNGASHIQAGIVGPSETIPIREGQLDLSTWQNVFFCEFDGPRRRRTIAITILGE